MLVVFSKTR